MEESAEDLRTSVFVILIAITNVQVELISEDKKTLLETQIPSAQFVHSSRIYHPPSSSHLGLETVFVVLLSSSV